jgi:hypothetical protein
MKWSTRQEPYRNLPTTRYGMPSNDGSRTVAQADPVEEAQFVLEALIENRSYPTGEDGRAVIHCLAAAYESNDNGHGPLRVNGHRLDSNRVFPWA